MGVVLYSPVLDYCATSYFGDIVPDGAGRDSPEREGASYSRTEAWMYRTPSLGRCALQYSTSIILSSAVCAAVDILSLLFLSRVRRTRINFPGMQAPCELESSLPRYARTEGRGVGCLACGKYLCARSGRRGTWPAKSQSNQATDGAREPVQPPWRWN